MSCKLHAPANSYNQKFLQITLAICDGKQKNEISSIQWVSDFFFFIVTLISYAFELTTVFSFHIDSIYISAIFFISDDLI